MSQIPVEYILPVNVEDMGPIEAHAKTVEAALRRDSEIRRREERREAAPCVRFDSAAPGGLVPAGTTFSSWQRAGRWDPLQAALLLCGFNPKGYRNEVIEGIPVIYARRLSGGTAAHRDAFACVREVEELLSRRADPESKVIPSEFVQWCRTEGLDTRWIDSAGEPIPALPKDEQVKAQQDERLSYWRGIGGREEKGKLRMFNELVSREEKSRAVRCTEKTIRADLKAAIKRENQSRVFEQLAKE